MCSRKKIYTLFSIILYSVSMQLIASEKNLLEDSPLILAIQQNDEKRVEHLLQNGAQPNSEDKYGNHPLHLAMEWDTEQENPFYKKRKILPNIVKLLLKYKANPNARYQFKNATPLHAAVFHNASDIVI